MKNKGKHGPPFKTSGTGSHAPHKKGTVKTNTIDSPTRRNKNNNTQDGPTAPPHITAQQCTNCGPQPKAETPTSSGKYPPREAPRAPPQVFADAGGDGGRWGVDGGRWGADEACLRVRGGPMLRCFVDALDR